MREGDRAHTAGDKQGKAELGSSKSLNLVALHQAKIWPWQGTGWEDVTTLPLWRSAKDRTITLSLFWVNTGLFVYACKVMGFGKYQEPMCNSVNSETCVRWIHNSPPLRSKLSS